VFYWQNEAIFKNVFECKIKFCLTLYFSPLNHAFFKIHFLLGELLFPKSQTNQLQKLGLYQPSQLGRLDIQATSIKRRVGMKVQLRFTANPKRRFNGQVQYKAQYIPVKRREATRIQDIRPRFAKMPPIW